MRERVAGLKGSMADGDAGLSTISTEGTTGSGVAAWIAVERSKGVAAAGVAVVVDEDERMDMLERLEASLSLLVACYQR